MTQDQRDKLLDLHRDAMKAAEGFHMGDCSGRTLTEADDRFRDYLMGLEITE